MNLSDLPPILNIARLQFDPILHEGYQGNQQIEPDIADAQEKINVLRVRRQDITHTRRQIGIGAIRHKHRLRVFCLLSNTRNISMYLTAIKYLLPHGV
jgi:hypothetical protein